MKTKPERGDAVTDRVDLDELERLHASVAQKRRHVAIYTTTADQADVVKQINGIINALPGMIRELREARAALKRLRDEAEVRICSTAGPGKREPLETVVSRIAGAALAHKEADRERE